MPFPTQLLHRADVPLTSNEGSNHCSPLAGQITQIPNSVSWPSGFGEMGKSQIKRSVFSMAVSLAVRRRRRHRHRSKQTLCSEEERRLFRRTRGVAGFSQRPVWPPPVGARRGNGRVLRDGSVEVRVPLHSVSHSSSPKASSQRAGPG